MALMAKIWTWATLVGGEWPTTATHAFACRFFGFSYFSTSLIVLIQVYNWEIRHHSLFCCCGLVDILYLYLICLFFTVTRQRTFPGVWAFQANPYRLGRLSQKRISVGKFEEEGRAGRDTSILLSGWISFCWTQNLSIVNQASFGH